MTHIVRMHFSSPKASENVFSGEKYEGDDLSECVDNPVAAHSKEAHK